MVSFSPEKYSDLVNFRGWVVTIALYRDCSDHDKGFLVDLVNFETYILVYIEYWYIKYNDKL